jgi:hypothetical protein
VTSATFDARGYIMQGFATLLEAAALGPKSRAYVGEHARILAEAALARIIDADETRMRPPLPIRSR